MMSKLKLAGQRRSQNARSTTWAASQIHARLSSCPQPPTRARTRVFLPILCPTSTRKIGVVTTTAFLRSSSPKKPFSQTAGDFSFDLKLHSICGRMGSERQGTPRMTRSEMQKLHDEMFANPNKLVVKKCRDCGRQLECLAKHSYLNIHCACGGLTLAVKMVSEKMRRYVEKHGSATYRADRNPLARGWHKEQIEARAAALPDCCSAYQQGHNAWVVLCENSRCANTFCRCEVVKQREEVAA